MHFWCRDFVTSCGIESLQGKYLNGNRMSRIFAVAWQRRIYLGKGRQLSNRIDWLSDWMGPGCIELRRRIKTRKNTDFGPIH